MKVRLTKHIRTFRIPGLTKGRIVDITLFGKPPIQYARLNAENGRVLLLHWNEFEFLEEDE